jgi:PPM family protein phosphatase
VNVASLPSSRFATSSLVLGSRGAGEDRIAIVPCAGGLVLAVADGAGGMGGGAAAAEALISSVAAAAEALASGALDPSALLIEIDQAARRDPQSKGGQCTAVIAIVRDSDVSGASVGDSGALQSLPSGSGAIEDLTAGQQRKPLIGSGAAVPVSFRGSPLEGTLLLATDGLLKYASWKRLTAALDHPVLDELPALLLALVRLPSGALQDDVGLIVCRR